MTTTDCHAALALLADPAAAERVAGLIAERDEWKAEAMRLRDWAAAEIAKIERERDEIRAERDEDLRAYLDAREARSRARSQLDLAMTWGRELHEQWERAYQRLLDSPCVSCRDMTDEVIDLRSQLTSALATLDDRTLEAERMRARADAAAAERDALRDEVERLRERLATYVDADDPDVSAREPSEARDEPSSPARTLASALAYLAGDPSAEERYAAQSLSRLASIAAARLTEAADGENLAVTQREEGDARRLSSALENVRMLAMRMRRTDPENAAHLLRFCADAGVTGSVLRAGVSCASPAPRPISRVEPEETR